jgi:hypothetical protein
MILEDFFNIRALILMLIFPLGICHAGSYPQISYKDLPDTLRTLWLDTKPEMVSTSHCAAAFDSYSDSEKMVFKCSIFIKMSAEGERRALQYCDENRLAKGVKSQCKLIVE